MRSKIEERCFRALDSLGSYVVREQYPIGERLRVDFVILELGLAVEADGRQHEEMNIHFFDSKDDFKASQNRDRRKEQLCLEAGLTLVRLDEKTIKQAKNEVALAKEILTRFRAQVEAKSDDW